MALKRSTGEINFYSTDHLGSTTVVTDAVGAKAEEIRYYPYGLTLSDTGTVSLSHKYTSQELDSESNLYYYGARYYDPALSKFISPDPAKPQYTNPQQLNKYSYVLNNPLNYTDPSGKKAFWYHFIDGWRAAKLIGYGFWDSLKFAWKVMALDFDYPNNERLHATASEPKESAQDAMLEARIYADKMWKQGKPEYTVHTLGDIPTHEGEFYEPTMGHLIKDIFSPGSFKEDVKINIEQLMKSDAELMRGTATWGLNMPEYHRDTSSSDIRMLYNPSAFSVENIQNNIDLRLSTEDAWSYSR